MKKYIVNDNNSQEMMDWVYSQLEDEESKFIYENKRKFILSGDNRYIDEIVDRYVKELAQNKWYPDKEKELVSLIKKNGKKVIIFGAGVRGRQVLNLCIREGIEVGYFCDNDVNLWGTKIEDKIPVISLDELMTLELYKEYGIIISPAYTYAMEITNVLNALKKVMDIYRYADYTPIVLEQKQYFDGNIIHLVADEVFVDGGCYNFGSSLTLLRKMKEAGINCKKIYAFEPDERNFQKCRKKVEESNFKEVELVQAGLWSLNMNLQFDAQGSEGSCVIQANNGEDNWVKAIALDLYIKEKVTFIKMDIEGAELEALYGAEKLILRDKPKLAICIYHKAEDMWKIPYYIKSLVPEYKLYIRHYSNYRAETVLYAIYSPVEL